MNVLISWYAYFDSFNFLKEINKDVNTIASFTLFSMEDCVQDADLIIFPGGSDVYPKLYGEDQEKGTYVDTQRDVAEYYILRRGLELNKKMLGICRGHQLINVLTGGILVQDIFNHRDKIKEISGIDEEIYHHPSWHPVDITDKELRELFPYAVNSMHHQAIIKPGKNLKSTSTYNGVIESTRGESIYTVQWHPEFMVDKFRDRFFNYILEWSK